MCQFWNASKLKVNCLASNVTNGSASYLSNYFGTWDTSGVVKVRKLSNGSTLVCRTTHLSTFAAGVDLTISDPDLSLQSFNPANAPYT